MFCQSIREQNALKSALKSVFVQVKSFFLLDLVFSLVVKIVHLSLVTVQAVIQPAKPTGDQLQTKPAQWKVNCYRREQAKMVPARVFVRVCVLLLI